MKKIPILLLSLLATTLTQAKSFRLKNLNTQKILGPYTQGDIITIGTNRYAILPPIPTISIKHQLNHIIIPQINFRQLDLRDAVSFLKDSSIKYDPKKIGVNFILMPLTQTPSKNNLTLASPRYPKITMNIKNVSLKDTLSLIQSATAYTIHIEHNAIVIRPPTPLKR